MSDEHWHVDLPFRGTRDYVHSTSICNHLRTRFADAVRFELVMREWMAARVVFSPLEEGSTAKATLRIETPDGAVQRFGLTDDPAHPVRSSEPFDEDALTADAPIDGKVLTSAAHDGATFFDRLISSNKALINRVLQPKVKLIAAKVDVAGFPPDDRAFQLRLDSHLGTRIFRSTLLIDGAKQGEVVFYGQ